jgi:hypothetical protein
MIFQDDGAAGRKETGLAYALSSRKVSTKSERGGRFLPHPSLNTTISA